MNKRERKLRAELVEKVDREIDADRVFFQRWPHRNDRVRRIFSNEHALIVHDGGPLRLPPGAKNPDVYIAMVIVKQLSPGMRIRKFCMAPRSLDADLLSEEQAQMAFEQSYFI